MNYPEIRDKDGMVIANIKYNLACDIISEQKPCCSSCGIEVTNGLGCKFTRDIQNEVKFGGMYPEQVRDMGCHFYCKDCALYAPKGLVTSTHISVLGIEY